MHWLVVSLLLLLAVGTLALAPNDDHPTTPATESTGTISTFVLNSTEKSFTNEKDNSSQSLTPYPFTALSETVHFEVTFPDNNTKSLYGVWTISNVIFLIFTFNATNSPISLPTFGPCAGNDLSQIGKHVWTRYDLSQTDLDGITITGFISRVYQDAELQPDVPQWILFGSGVSSYYAVAAPSNQHSSIWFEIRRRNSSVALPSKIFKSLSIATDQQCLNPVPNRPGGVIERFDITGDLEEISHTFSAVIPSNSTVYVLLYSDLSPSNASIYNELYFITAHFGAPSPVEPQTNQLGIIIGVPVGVLVLIASIGLIYYLCKNRTTEYSQI